MSLDVSALCSGMFSDELDRMGFREQVVGGMRLNRSGLSCLGKARTVDIETVATDDENIGVGLGFLEQLEPGEILCVSGSGEYAYFGELMTRLAIRRGVGGVAVGGLTRDHRFTRGTELPIFSTGYSPKDIKGRGRVRAVDVPIDLCGVPVNSGDWVYGDDDGVVVVPAALESRLFATLARVIEAERDVIKQIAAGRSIDTILATHKEF